MAVYYNMPLRMRVVVLAAFCVVLLSVGVRAQSPPTCDAGDIITDLSACGSTEPTPGDACCQGFVKVRDIVDPDEACVCEVLTSGILAIKNVSIEAAKKAIQICIGDSYVPTTC